MNNLTAGESGLEDHVPVAVERTTDLVHLFFYGPVGIADLVNAGDALDRIDRDTPDLPRLIDTSQVTGVDLDFEALRRFAGRRTRSSLDHGVRIAIVAEVNTTFVYAQIFQALRRRPNVVVEVFRRGTDALAWMACTA